MGKRRLAVLLLAASLAAGSVAAAAALAQDVPTVPEDTIPTTPAPDPYATGEQVIQQTRDDPATGETTAVPDTDFTPDGTKQTNQWKVMEGASFGADAVHGDSVTSFSDDLYTVAFPKGRTNDGYAGGSTCREEPQRMEGEADAAFEKRVASCADEQGNPGERVPVLYHYKRNAEQGARWEKVDFPGDDHPGYIGAIAWDAATGEVMAVGGTGTYPRREPAYGAAGWRGSYGAANAPPKDCDLLPSSGNIAPEVGYGFSCDEAGQARAWVYHAGHWQDLSDGLQEKFPSLHGMTAFDCSVSQLSDICFGGALGQMVRWENGQFAKTYVTGPACRTATGNVIYVGGDPSCEDTRRALFVFRVRQIRFAPDGSNRAYAVTAGCCAESSLNNEPRTLGWNRAGGDGDVWWVNYWDPQEGYCRDGAAALCPIPFGPGNAPGTRPGTRPEMPDSIYSFVIGRSRDTGTPYRIGLVMTPGGVPEAERPERPSIATEPYCTNQRGGRATGVQSQQLQEPDQAFEALRMNLSTARLVAGDGDIAMAFEGFGGNKGGPSDIHEAGIGGELGCYNGYSDLYTGGDAVPDWMVGELRSTDQGLGARALLLSTTTRPSRTPDAIGEPQATDLLAGKLPTSRERLAAYLRSQYFTIDTYSLNALNVVDPFGVGWAVGQHGAIAQLGDPSGLKDEGSGIGGGDLEPPPPTLGGRRPAQLPSAATFGASGPASGQAGPVPSLASRPEQRLPSPRLISAGSANPTLEPRDDLDFARQDVGVEDVRQVVMSRDGSEGWALGGNMSPYHYDGVEWSRCDPDGIPAIGLPPDRACESLAPLRYYLDPNGRPTPVAITAAARVPLEKDADPSNDDDFEALAIGTSYRESADDPERPAVIRYRDGRWRAESDFPFDAPPDDLYFTAPDDGWAVITTKPFGSGPLRQGLFHFDGTQWWDCRPVPAPPQCDDPGGLLKFRDPSDGTDKPAGLVGAGNRVYVYGYRKRPGATYPMVIAHERGGTWTTDRALGGYDPASDARRAGEQPPGSEQGEVDGLAITQLSDGDYGGWAYGRFQVNTNATVGLSADADTEVAQLPPRTTMLRLGGSGWAPFNDTGPVHDYMSPATNEAANDLRSHKPRTDGHHMVVAPTPDGHEAAFMVDVSACGGPPCPLGGRLYGFDEQRGRWELVPIDEPAGGGFPSTDGTLVSDNKGGFWLAAPRAILGGGANRFDFFHYADRAPRLIFEEAPSPLRDPTAYVTSLAGALDGTVWAGTKSGTLYRYNRALGWDRAQIPGWDARIAGLGSSSAIYAVAVGPDGHGLAVGQGGRIADISPDEVLLDAAAGVGCNLADVSPPCGTGRDLRSADIADDGSGAAMAGGDRLSLLWRPSSGNGLRAIQRPGAPPSSTITGVALPTANRAFVTTDSGAVYAGSGSGGHWSWVRESIDAGDHSLTLDRNSSDTDALRAIAVDSSMRGYAVGDRGLVLRRTGDGANPWVRVKTPFLDHFTSVSLPVGGGFGALIGGESGIILTEGSRGFELARPADRSDGTTGRIVGLALMPGELGGQTEAWAATAAHDAGFFSGSGSLSGAGHAVSQFFHYASDPGDPLLQPASRTNPLPDSAAPRPDEVSFAAFGKTDCRPGGGEVCDAMGPGMREDQLDARRTVDEIAGAAGQQGGPAFAVFTGDVADSGGAPGIGQVDANASISAQGTGTGAGLGLLVQDDTFNAPDKRRRWQELIGRRLEGQGVPLYAAVGARDLANPPVCYGSDRSTCLPTQQAKAGDSSGWRTTFATEAAPWGAGDPPSTDSHSFSPVEDPKLHTAAGDAPGQVSPPDQEVDNPGLDTPVGPGPDAVSVPFGQARTHYAFDLYGKGSDAPAARFVFVDTSQGSLSGAEASQQPFELSGGQSAWLKQMLCRPSDEAKTGDAGCTRGEDEPAVVVSSTPTYTYAAIPPTETQSDAAALETLLFQYGVSAVVSGRLGWNGLYYALSSVGGVHSPNPGDGYPSAPPDALPGQPAPIPFAVASGAGGGFGGTGGTASEGFWHGYTIVRVSPDGDPGKTIVEQRPLLDWVGIMGPTHTVRARKKLQLEGAGREPLGFVAAPYSAQIDTRYDAIDTPAITHRFDLLAADPDQPWLPKQGEVDDNCDPYDCLDPGVGQIDPQSGLVRAGSGNYRRTFAIAQLSVAGKAATFPLMFEPRASYRPPPPPPAKPPVVVPPLAVPTPPPNPAPPSVSLSAPPLVALPTLTAASPPSPPVPPTFASQAPIDLSITPAALDVLPPTAVSQPPTPPVNPAPPSGARREARQRQAAAQKSGADRSEGTEETQDAGGDLAQSPPTDANAASRNDFTALAHREQPSAWARDALIGGGLGIAALILALGMGTARPTPRRREPELPAPAWARDRRR